MMTVIEKSIYINAPPAQVWKVFTNISSWQNWWPNCLEAKAITPDPWIRGGRFSLLLKLPWMVVRYVPFISKIIPTKEVVWIIKDIGVTEHNCWQFIPEENGTKVIEHYDFDGIGVILLRLLGQVKAIRRMLGENLAGLKKEVEKNHYST